MSGMETADPSAVPAGRPRVLVSRTDAIGDVVLSLPACALLKRHSGAEIHFLASDYTRPVVEASPFVDEFHSWSSVASASARDQAAFLRAIKADIIVHLFPRADVARAAALARIPRRIATSRRFYNWFFCNELESVARRSSDLHEAQLNVRLLDRLLPRSDWSLTELAPFTILAPRATLPAQVETLLAPGRLNIVFHPGSHGSAREWPLDRWSALAGSLDPGRFRIFVTGTRAEGALLAPWIAGLPQHVTDLTGKLELDELITLLSRVDGIVAASTGPLHIGAAVGARTLGLYPATAPIHAGRWAPLGPRASTISAPGICPRCEKGQRPCTCMEMITVAQVAAHVSAWSR